MAYHHADGQEIAEMRLGFWVHQVALSRDSAAAREKRPTLCQACQCLRLDGGGEYFSHEFNNFLKKHGIQRQFSCRTPTAAVHDMTFVEKFIGTKVDVSHFKVFGCIAYVHVPNELRMKLDPKAEKSIFISYSIEQKGYKCYNPVTRQVRVNKDVVFDEMTTWYVEVKDDIGADVNKSVVENSDAHSQVLSGPQGSLARSHVANLWSEILRKEVSPASSINVSKKGKEKVHESMRIPNVTGRHDDVDRHSSGSEYSLEEELGIPSVRTQG
ncbi:hypothetical protein L7F22_058496 [Adiantum nelumboides]|nr:hypothetical protein [Adiantum nelumboides]